MSSSRKTSLGTSAATRFLWLGLILFSTLFATNVAQAQKLSTSSDPLAAKIFTDQTEYIFGSVVYFTGENYRAGETVTLSVTDSSGTLVGKNNVNPWQVTVDGAGKFYTSWEVLSSDDYVATLDALAKGSTSNKTAGVVFGVSNTILRITSFVPDSLCPTDGGDSIVVCANLVQACQNKTESPLEGREILFFFNSGNCGVSIGQNSDDSVLTDSLGNACVKLAVPTGTGRFSIRVKFRGESKPNPCPDTGNSACNPFHNNPNKRCKALGNSNDCRGIEIDTGACNQPPVVTCPGPSTVFLCAPDTVCVSALTISDRENNVVDTSVSFGSIVGDQICFPADTAGIYTITVIATDI
ncbi:MAG: hypothetical protein IIB00_08870, partial [candidate division Zixibacteria bacterium]|nr:hypothetical protein [candidate division Zixibacteria bacterium]